MSGGFELGLVWVVLWVGVCGLFGCCGLVWVFCLGLDLLGGGFGFASLGFGFGLWVLGLV